LNKAVLVVKYNAHLLNQLLFRNYKHWTVYWTFCLLIMSAIETLFFVHSERFKKTL